MTSTRQLAEHPPQTRRRRRESGAAHAHAKLHTTRGSLLVAAVLCVSVSAADDYDLIRSTVDGGGTIFCTGGHFELSGTVGQPDAGRMTGGVFELSAGFWFAASPGDCNIDGLTDLVDYGTFNPCISGPGSAIRPECSCYDLDADNDIDLLDVAGFQHNFFGG